MAEEIDFVVTWVDGEDSAWQDIKKKYKAHSDYGDREERYRSWGLMRYWFRGVEQYAPWVRRIHFVTWGHLPEWLETAHPKLHIVRHEEFLPKELLPVFNSSLIERYLHRIPGLSERFVFFNDDMFLMGKALPQQFFCGGKPCDLLALQPVVANPANPGMSHLFLNNTLILAKYFRKRDCFRAHPGHFLHVGYPPLYFGYNLLELCYPQLSGLYTVHGPSPLLISTYEVVWEKEKVYLDSLGGNRFREDTDVNQYLFREWQKLSGWFVPRNVQRGFRYYELQERGANGRLLGEIRKGRCRVLCINDTGHAQDVQAVKGELRDAFEIRLPQRSSYERVAEDETK
ncbi:MAG: Stealth CR1 domain-containing protein [Lachnospiraceae bacterium]|nr:Stealth CR1 domain-containing protein [Lachnospiraceae bacterium]